MKRRSFIVTWLAAIAASTKALKAGSLDQWLNSSATPGTSAATIPVKPWTPAKVMKWACICLRRGAHWTIGAINFAAASIGQVRHHLVSVHGHNYAELSGLDKETLGNLHDAHHEGRRFRQYAFPATPPNGVDHLNSSCPGGHCPIPRRTRHG